MQLQTGSGRAAPNQIKGTPLPTAVLCWGTCWTGRAGGYVAGGTNSQSGRGMGGVSAHLAARLLSPAARLAVATRNSVPDCYHSEEPAASAACRFSMAPTNPRRRPWREPRPALTAVVSVFSFLSPYSNTAVFASTPFEPSSNLFRGVGDDSPLARTMKGAGAARFGGETGGQQKRGAIEFEISSEHSSTDY